MPGLDDLLSLARTADPDELREHILTGYKSGKPFTPYIPTLPLPSPIDLRYQSDPNVAQSAADFVESSYNSLTRRAQEVTFVANESHDKMLLALTVEPGDRITISEPVTGLANAQVLVQSVALTVNEGFITCTLGLSPASSVPYWRWDIVGQSEWDFTTIYGF